MSVLVIAEHDNRDLKNATLSAVTAALTLDADVHVLVAGQNCASVASAVAELRGVTKVLQAEAVHYQHQLAEEIAPLIASIGGSYQAVIAASTTSGKNLLPRAAALLNVQPVSDVLRIVSPDIFERSMYAGNVVATVQSSDPIKVLTVRPTAFDPAKKGEAAAPIHVQEALSAVGVSEFVDEVLAQSDRPELGSAKVVISGGRGLQSGENFRLLYDLADRLNAAVGASRAAVDAGFVPNDMQVGQTGKIVAPDLYIAVGISGAIQHLAGMKDSKVIVAINKDADAAIFQAADYGLVADLFTALPELTEKLS